MEILGNFDAFKAQIQSLSGSTSGSADDAIAKLVKDGNLIVIIDYAAAPDIKKLYTREI